MVFESALFALARSKLRWIIKTKQVDHIQMLKLLITYQLGRFARSDGIAQAISWLCDSTKSGFVIWSRATV